MKYNYEAQEKVVTAIYTFTRNNSKFHKNCTSILPNGEEIEVSLEAVGVALKEIMSAFDYEVQPVP